MKRIVVGLIAAVALCGHAAEPAAASTVGVFVDDVHATDPALAGDASSLTSMLCSELSKDPHFDVTCAPDVRQLLDFEAASAATGKTSTMVARLLQHLDSVKHVVTGTLEHDGGGVVWKAHAGPRAAASPPQALAMARETITVVENGGMVAIFEHASRAAERLRSALQAVPASAPPPLLAPTPTLAPVPTLVPPKPAQK